MRRDFRNIVAATILLLLCSSVVAQHRVGLLFYDVDKLYDTIPSLFYDDTPYTPSGKLNWNSERYHNKIERCAAVLDSTKMPIVALYGVENLAVVRDIVSTTKEDYTYVHHTLNSLDGLDFALLYYGDMLFIESTSTQRDLLRVDATYGERELTIIITKCGRDLEALLPTIDNNRLIVVMGEVTAEEIVSIGYRNLMLESERRGYGNVRDKVGWSMQHRIATNYLNSECRSGVFISNWLLNSSMTKPLASFDNGYYVGGYSKFLPLFAYIW